MIAPPVGIIRHDGRHDLRSRPGAPTLEACFRNRETNEIAELQDRGYSAPTVTIFLDDPDSSKYAQAWEREFITKAPKHGVTCLEEPDVEDSGLNQAPYGLVGVVASDVESEWLGVDEARGDTVTVRIPDGQHHGPLIEPATG